MTFVRLSTIILAPLLALSACSESQPEEAPPSAETELEVAEIPTVAPSEYGDTASEDEVVIEVEPDIGGTEPMDAGLPMENAQPMVDDLGGGGEPDPVE